MKKLSFHLIEYWLFASLVCLAFPLYTQENTFDYSHIKNMIDSKRVVDARKEIDFALKNNPNDPTLNFYNTELWILEADYFSERGEYARAIPLYEKVKELYPSNPLVKNKYDSAKAKLQTNSNEVTVKNTISVEPELETKEKFFVSTNLILLLILILLFLLFLFILGLTLFVLFIFLNYKKEIKDGKLL